MATAINAPVRLDGYQLRLSSFEGPLDVLLRLIEREQLPVNEISLVAVLDQFLGYMDALGHLPPETIADFAAVACRLSVLKSRALLPRPDKADDEFEVLDLVRQLEEYRAIRSAAEHLANRQRDGIGAFGPGVGIDLPLPEPPRLVPQQASALSKAVSRWIARLPPQPTPLRSLRTVSLREMISRLFQALSSGHSLSFDTLRSGCHSRHELAVAFLALLVLMRRQLVVAHQAALFGPISLSRCGQEPSVEPMSGLIGSIEADEADGSDKLFA